MWLPDPSVVDSRLAKLVVLFREYCPGRRNDDGPNLKFHLSGTKVKMQLSDTRQRLAHTYICTYILPCRPTCLASIECPALIRGIRCTHRAHT